MSKQLHGILCFDNKFFSPHEGNTIALYGFVGLSVVSTI